MDKRVSYLGQLYRGEPQTKSWSQLVPGQVSIHLLEGEGRAAGEWKLAAFKKDKVWECRLDPRTKFRAKKDFLQWQTKGGGGEPVTYGIRLKDSETATQLNDRITEVLNAMMSKPPEGDEVQLRVLFSSREPTLLTVRNSTTMIQILRMFCQKCQLEHTQFIIAPPSDSAHHPPLKPSTTVGSLKTKEVQVVRKGSRAPPTGPAPHPPPSAAPIEATDSNGLSANEQLVQVELPCDERTKIRVSPQVTISQLLRLICEKRNLEVSDHRFDLPATEESLAGKTLEQLKITSIRVVMREEAKKRLEQQRAQEAAMEQSSEGGEKQGSQSPSRSKRKSTRRNKIESSAGESPKGNRRQAPPPPPPLQTRRSQPCLIKELAVAAEKKATLRRVGQSSDHEETLPEMRSTRTVNSTYHHHGDHDKDSECSTEGTPEQERKMKVPLLPSTSRSALQPRSFPPPPLPPAASKATPTSAEIAPPPGTAKTSDSDGPHKTIAPPPVAEKPKKKRVTSLEDFDEPDSAPHPYQAPPTQPEEEVEHPPPPDMVGVVDMDTLIEEAATVETPVKKTKKKVKKKHTSEDGSAGTATGQKEKKTKSGKTTKKKKKISSQPVDISEVGSLGELRQEESLEREVSPQLEDPSSLLPPPPPPPVLTEEDRQLLEREAETYYHHQQQQQPEEPSPPSLPPPHFEQPATMASSLKQLSPDVKQRNTASLRRRPRGPAPPPPPPGSKTMTLGRIRPSGAGGEHRDVTTKSRGFTVLGAATESSREHHSRPASDEIITKPRSVSDALPTPSERETIATVTTSRTPVGTRHRPTRRAPSRPAPATPPTKGGDVKVDEGKSAESRPKSLTGSPRRPPPNVPTAAPPPPPPTTTDDEDRDTDTVRMEFKDDHAHGDDSGEFEENGDASPHNRNKESEEGERDNATPPSTPPKPRGDQRWSPGQSPSGGRRKEAATVICKDTEDGGKELIVKPSPHSKRRFAGPLVFKMPPPPSAPPSKAKAKKPPPPISAKPGKRDGTGSSVAETHSHDIYAESADSSVSESVSDMPGELASSLKASSPPKSLSDTLVSNEFTNLDELLSDSQQDNIATTNFSIEENLEPINEYNGLEWNNSGLADSDSIPYQDPDLETAAALNFNSNNNNNYLEAEDDYNYGDFPPPPEIPPPLSARSGEDSDEWERDSNRTGELNFDSDSSTTELSKHSIEDGIVVLDEEAGPGGVVLLNVKRTDDDSPVFPDELEQIDETASDNDHLIPDPPAAASIARDPSIGAQLNELDDVVSSLAELAAEVPSLPPPAPPTPPPAPSLFTPSQPYPITSSTPTQQQEGEEHRPSSPEPPPIPLTLPPSLSDNEDLDDDDDFPIGPPPPLVTSEPPSLTPSPPSSPLNDSRTSEKEQQQEDRDFELLNKLKQRQVKGSSSRRRRRGSRDQEAVAVDDGESELLEKLKQRQTLYKQKAKARREEQENEPSSTMEHATGPHSIPSQPPGMGTGTGGDTVQLQLQFLQQQVLQQQMMQLQQQFQNLHSYALQQGVSMPTNMMQVPPGVGGAMLNQQAAFMTTPMAPPTGVAAPQPQQQVVMQTSSGPVLVPAASVAQMMPAGQGVMPNPQVPAPVLQQQNLMGGQLPGQGFASNAVVYGQEIAQPRTQPPLMSTSVTTSQPVVYGQVISQASAPPPLPQSQPPAMATTSIASNQPITHGQGVSQDAEAPPPPPPTAPPTTAVGISSSNETGTGTKDTPARTLSQQKKRSEDVRALVLGPLEEQFDSLMDQVRDADPTAVLKKIPEDEEEEREEPSSSYTGMAAALAEALKQRRLHVADKRQSLGELDESNSEWQSP